MSQELPTVIVVDDEECLCRAMDRLLRSVGYRVQTFASPEAFVNCLPPDGPGCVLLDVAMPGLDGLELQQKLIASARIWPIIFVTGQADISISVRAMKAGAIDFLTKPAEDTALLSAIAEALTQDADARAERSVRQAIEARVARLTAREREVFSLVVAGLLNKQIAAELGTAEKTIKVHRSRVMEKLEVGSLADLVHLAHRLDIRWPEERGTMVATPPRLPELLRSGVPGRRQTTPVSGRFVRGESLLV